jgi:hypothetical protein
LARIIPIAEDIEDNRQMRIDLFSGWLSFVKDGGKKAPKLEKLAKDLGLNEHPELQFLIAPRGRKGNKPRPPVAPTEVAKTIEDESEANNAGWGEGMTIADLQAYRAQKEQGQE